MDLKRIIPPVLAQSPAAGFNVELEGIGPLGLEGLNPNQAGIGLTKILSGIIGIMTFAAGIWFVIRIFVGAYHFLAAGGDSSKVSNALETIRNAIIGLLIVIGAIFLISMLGKVLHVEFLDVIEILNRISP